MNFNWNLSVFGAFDKTLTFNNTGGIVAVGNLNDLFEWGTAPTNGFASAFILPALSGGLSWDTSALYTTGGIAVVPEPESLALCAVAGVLVLCHRRRRTRIALWS